MKYFLKISNIKIIVNSIKELHFLNTEDVEPFKVAFAEEDADLIYDISYVDTMNSDYIKKFGGKKLHEVTGCKIYQKENQYVLVHKPAKNESDAHIIVEINQNRNRHHIYIPEEYVTRNIPIYLTALLGIDLVLPHFQRIMMHASIVKYENAAILFTGPSGMGKSTQANLWKTYKGASVINGDRAILSVEEQIYAYGSPYAGSSGIYINECAPVKMIVLLRQDKENKIEKLEEKEAYRMLFPRFLMTKWDKHLLIKTLDLIECLLKKVPVYLLSCRPDEEAVELVYQKLLNMT